MEHFGLTVRPARFKRVGGLAYAALLAVLLLLPFVFRRSQSQRAAARPHKAVKLTIMSSHWEGVRWEFGRAFSMWVRRTTGRKVYVEWLDVGGTSDAVKFIQSEFARSPSGIGIDLLFGGGIEAHMHLARKGLLSKVRLDRSVLSAVPEEASGMLLRDPKGRWFGAALGGFGIIFNRPVLRRMKLPEPRTWEDLARPEMHTWVGSADPRSSGSTHMVYEIILQAYGWEKGYGVAARVGANVRTFSRSSADVPRDTALGEVACGTALDSYAWSQIARVESTTSGSDPDTGRGRLGYVLPERLTVINPDGVAVLKGSRRPKLARQFIEFVLSRAGQSLWMLPSGARGGPARFTLARMSVRPEMFRLFAGRTPVKVNPFEWTQSSPYNESTASRRWEALNTLLGACLIDGHDHLRRAWKAVIRHGLKPKLVQQLVRPPISEAQFMELGGRWAKEPGLRSRWRSRWVRTCRDRYARISRMLDDRRGCGCGK
jgi:ABC-type Fe3+ transport system substrate-binding protein